MIKNIPRIEYLKVQNYRALHNLELKNLTPLTVFLGPNGSGKSTIFDVFTFLSECFTESLRKAWDRRGRFRELRTRDNEGCIIIELKYKETSKSFLITYHLAIGEENNRPFIAEEWLHWRRGQYGKPFRFLDFRKGEGQEISGESPEVLYAIAFLLSHTLIQQSHFYSLLSRKSDFELLNSRMCQLGVRNVGLKVPLWYR
jgi:predicted ATPase